MGSEYLVSIVICTRNRAFILGECLESLTEQSISSENFELLVIDNASEDRTRELVKAFAEKFIYYRYLLEPKIGLSHARNRGWKAARGKWIIYLDDDARAAADFVQRALWTIEHYNFDLFGGQYYAWFKYGRPAWLPEAYGTKEKLRDHPGEINEGFASGGIMAVKKSVLAELGGFASFLGMNKSLGYGEEDEFQIRLRRKGYKIGFDPEWKIDHCVLPDKLQLSWHFKAAFAQGRDQAIIFQERYSISVILYGMIRSSFGLLWKLPRALLCWVTKDDYSKEKALFILGIPLMFQIGRINGWISKNFNR